MKEIIQRLTVAERVLLERFKRFDVLTLPSAVKDVFDEYKDQVFMQDVLVTLIEDVFNVLSIRMWDKTAYQKVINCAKSIYQETNCFFPANDHFLFAISIVWIGYCCKYKEYGYVRNLSSKTNGLANDSKQLQYSLCAQFFNYFAGPARGKAKAFEKYMFKVHGDFYRDSDENTKHSLNFESLIYLLSITNFLYQFPNYN